MKICKKYVLYCNNRKKYLKSGINTYKQDLEYHRSTSLKDRNADRRNELDILREKSEQKARTANMEIDARKAFRRDASKKNRIRDTEI